METKSFMRFCAFLLALTVTASLVAVHAEPRKPREMGLLPQPVTNLFGWKNPGDIPALPETGELVVQRLRPTDCRVVLGFIHSPVDGRPDSWGYNGVVQEYNDSQNYADGRWQNVTYEHVRNPGVHVVLADDSGFNYLYLRGGFTGQIYRDVDALDGPGKGILLADIKTEAEPVETDHFRFSRLSFSPLVKSKKISFFLRDNMLSDTQFYRIGSAAVAQKYSGAMEYSIGKPVEELTGLGPDFIQLPAEPGEQHPSNFERRFPQNQRAARLLAREATGQSVALEPEKAVHFFTPPLPDNLPVGAARLDLHLPDAPAGNLINITVQDPLIGNQELLRVDVKMNADGHVRCLLDFPDQLVAPGRRFWITLASQHASTMAADSKISLLTVDEKTARAEYFADRLFLLKGYFYVLSEYRPWTGREMNVNWLEKYDGSGWEVQRVRPQLLDLFRTVEYLNALDVDHTTDVAQYGRWLTRYGKPLVEPKDVPSLAGISGVPRWALLLDRVKNQIVEIPQWWIEHRMAPSGELGGTLQDDTDMLQWWIPSALFDSERFAPRAREAFSKIATLVLKYNLKDGVNIRTTDALHAYEEGQNHMAIMPLLFYGDPRYVEWLMQSARTTDKWTRRGDDGKLKFLVDDFGWDTAQNPPTMPAKEVTDNAALLLHSHLMLAWYNGNPHAVEVLKGYAATQGGWGDGAYGGGASINFAAYWLSGDTQYLGLPQPDAKGEYSNTAAWAKRQPLFATHVQAARQAPWWKGYSERVRNDVLNGAWAWAATRDKESLEKSLEFALYGNPVSGSGGADKYRFIWTQAEMFTDRVYLPVEVPAQAMLGGYSVRNRLWPGYAVSYEKLGRDFAALVLEQGKDKLKLAAINLGTAPREGALRVWQLEPGIYELKIGPDANDDGVMDSVASTQTLSLKRMARVPLSLTPRRLMLYEFSQTKKTEPLYARADAAISPVDIQRQGSTLLVTVHNIGAAPLKNLEVVLLDAQDKILASTYLKQLDAPLDLLPKTATVHLPLKNGAARIVLNPKNAINEITDLNNSLSLSRQ